MERILTRWLITRLMDDHINTEDIEVRVMCDEEEKITSIYLKTPNGLKHYGTRIPEGLEDYRVRSRRSDPGDAEG